MSVVQLLLSALLGALAGAAASTWTASRSAQQAELGRVQEGARQELLAIIRLFRANVYITVGDAGWKSAMDENYLSAPSRLRFAEDVERQLVHLPPTDQAKVRTHIRKLCGPIDAESARLAAPESVVDRETSWRAQYFMRQARGLTPGQIDDHGLLGKARDAERVGEGVSEVIDELDAMQQTVHEQQRWPRRTWHFPGHR
jgi:type II secretory pathway pseudopilin PulG